MEDKSFELLTRLYSEFTDFKGTIINKVDSLENRFDSLENRFDSLENRFDNLEKKVEDNSRHILRLENRFEDKLNILFDGYRQVYEKLEEHDVRLERIESKLEKQDVEIRVIKGGREAK